MSIHQKKRKISRTSLFFIQIGNVLAKEISSQARFPSPGPDLGISGSATQPSRSGL